MRMGTDFFPSERDRVRCSRGLAAVTTAWGRRRCDQDDGNSGVCAEDLNAGSLMVLLGNELGLKGRMLIFDVDPSKEVCSPSPLVPTDCGGALL